VAISPAGLVLFPLHSAYGSFLATGKLQGTGNLPCSSGLEEFTNCSEKETLWTKTKKGLIKELRTTSTELIEATQS